MKKMILILFLVSLLVGCIATEKPCVQDSDCVPATCCHANEAVNKDQGPDCKGQLCTMECVPGTIDCGQGKVQCVDEMCKVVLNEG